MFSGFSLFPLLAQSTGGAAPAPPGMDSQFFVFVSVVLVALYVLVLRPQKKEQADRQAAVDALKKGDRVLTNGGMYGTIQEIDKAEGTVTLQVDKNVRLVFARSAIQPIVAKAEAAEAAPAAPAAQKS